MDVCGDDVFDANFSVVRSESRNRAKNRSGRGGRSLMFNMRNGGGNSGNIQRLLWTRSFEYETSRTNIVLSGRDGVMI